ncbi:MAG: rmuC [Glaciihabitans sp.]|nr:rmuC [Glaciihabitans sp.]
MSEANDTLGSMDPLVALLIGLAIGLVIGVVIGMLIARSRRVSTVTGENPAVVEALHAAALSEVRADEASQRAELSSEVAALQATASALRGQLEGQADQFREFTERTRLEQLERTERERAESKVLQALTPVQETLRTMQQKVTDLEAQRSLQHGELSQQLRSATESEERLRATADSLASALRNNASRGVWGEAQLRNVVESAGLINRVDFNLQSSINSDAGAGRPDMVVRLPGGKSIAVDAKVPYNSYLEASQIPPTATGEEEARRKQLLGAHAKQVKNHIDALSAKTYWAGLNASPEFTVAFIPSEPLLAAALEHDPTLLDYAFSKKIALASPVNLWAVLKTVAFTWQQDVLTEDAKRLFDLSKELYGRLGKLADHADKLRRSIDSTVTSYNQFASSLENRVLVTARKLEALDESKVIGPPVMIDRQPRQLTAVELELPEEEQLGA